MGDFSEDPNAILARSLADGYVGLRFENEVPVLDRDLNLLGDLLAAQLRGVLSRALGEGTRLGSNNGFRITQAGAQPGDNDFWIGEGEYLVGGLQVSRTGGTYTSQFNLPPLTTPPAGTTRDDVVYLDVWVSEITSEQDGWLNNPDVGQQTSVRIRPYWMVRVAEGTQVLPEAAPGHVHALLARLQRSGPKIWAGQITDTRQKALHLGDSVRRTAIFEGALRPGLVSSGQFSPNGTYPGQNVTVFGKHLNMGTPTVALVGVNGTFYAQLANIPGNPSPTQLVFVVPANATLVGHFVNITTVLGSVTSTERLYVCGPPAFNNPPGQLSPTTGPTNSNLNVTLFGSNFNAPNPQISVQRVGASPPTWTSVTVKPGSIGSTQIIATVSLATGSYKFRVQTDASSTPAISTDLLQIT